MISLMVDKTTREQRRAICAACPKIAGVMVMYCSVCKCAIRAKTATPGTSCPLNKW